MPNLREWKKNSICFDNICVRLRENGNYFRVNVEVFCTKVDREEFMSLDSRFRRRGKKMKEIDKKSPLVPYSHRLIMSLVGERRKKIINKILLLSATIWNILFGSFFSSGMALQNYYLYFWCFSPLFFITAYTKSKVIAISSAYFL